MDWIGRILLRRLVLLEHLAMLIIIRRSYDVEITGEVEGRAPVPVLNVGVRQVDHKNSTLCVETYFIRNYFQAGTLIDNELNVKPGTPLNMEVLNKSTILQSCQNLVYLDSIAYNLKGSSVYL